MQLHQIQPKHKPKDRKRIGRGGKRGNASGFGTGKQGSKQPRIREVLKRYPKLRGYRFESGASTQVVNLELLEKKFAKGDAVNPSILIKKRIIHKIGGSMPQVKILGTGDLTKALTFDNCKISLSAKAKIEKAGGTIR